MSELISSDLRLISVVLQPRLFQFSYTEFKGPIKTALNIWKQKLSFLFINAFPVILEELKSSMPPEPHPPQFSILALAFVLSPPHSKTCCAGPDYVNCFLASHPLIISPPKTRASSRQRRRSAYLGLPN